jgi:asparagine synthase (glutamine-hydrolysing)
MPGTILTLRHGRPPEITRYWDARQIAEEGLAHPLRLADSEATDRLEALLREAVGRQMQADVPLGAFLSGGTDSSTVVALMQAQSSRPVKTFTIGFRETGYNEADHAGAVARHLGTDHAALHVTAVQARDVIPSLATWFDEPFADSSQIPTFLLSKLARHHVTVSLSGDGGDEAFAGYRRYVLGDVLQRRLLALPLGLRRVVAEWLSAIPTPAWDRLFSLAPSRWRMAQAGDKLQKLADILTVSDEAAIYRRLISQWHSPERIVLGGREPEMSVWDSDMERRIPSFVERMRFQDMETYLPGDCLTKVDRSSMAVALEVRVPFLDPQVVAFGWRLPLEMKIRRGQGKWLLRQVLDRYVPRSLVERPKMGFGVPIGGWLRGPLREWAESLLEERALRSDGLLDPGVVRAKWQEHLSGRRNWQHPLWCVLMFQEWKARWLHSP